MAIENCMANQKDRDDTWEEWCKRNMKERVCVKGGKRCPHYIERTESVYQEEKETPTRE
jgi:hypothetical protein